jgi:hypothetical protein
MTAHIQINILLFIVSAIFEYRYPGIHRSEWDKLGKELSLISELQQFAGLPLP